MRRQIEIDVQDRQSSVCVLVKIVFFLYSLPSPLIDVVLAAVV
jgi:hypothetical protein